MKRALIIVYDGLYPALHIQKAAAETLASYGIIEDLDKIEIYAMDEESIVQAIAAKAIADANNQIVPKPEDWAADVMFKQFKEAILSADYEEFATALAIKLAIEMANDTDLVKAVRILAKEETENIMSDEIKSRYGLSKRIFQSIRRTLNLVCQGRHIIIR